jgi:hypothetical protein
MSEARLIIGDTRDVTATLADGSVDLIITSPPFLALRSYLPDDHPDKGREIGSEATPADFLDVLLDLTVEWRRVLAPHGSLVVELGDTYSGSGNPDRHGEVIDHWKPNPYGSATITRGRGPDIPKSGAGWPLAKSLCGIPDLYQQSLAYGRNLLRPDHTIEPWRIRNKIAWCRPNPPVGALGDKYRPATSYMTVACVSSRRYFDLDAVRTEHKYPDDDRSQRASVKTPDRDARLGAVLSNGGNPAGAPPLDWWEIPTHPFAGAHYATWPPALLVKPILSMCPQRVCRVCGKPSERIVEVEQSVITRGHYYDRDNGGAARSEEKVGSFKGRRQDEGDAKEKPSHHQGFVRHAETLGWTDCGCSTDGTHWRNGIVLDPFGGSGTTASVATGHGRDCILIDIDERNADLARERVGMFLSVEHHDDRSAA